MQRKINTVCYHLCVESKHKANETKPKQTHREQTSDYQLEESKWKRQVRSRDKEAQTTGY